MKRYFKILSDSATSIFERCGNTRTDYTVQYIENEWVRSSIKHGKLFVFDDLYKAFLWSQGMEYLKGIGITPTIYEVEVTNPQRIKKIPVQNIDFVKFWQKRHSKKHPDVRVQNPMENTLVVDAVKLVRKMVPVECYKYTKKDMTSLSTNESNPKYTIQYKLKEAAFPYGNSKVFAYSRKSLVLNSRCFKCVGFNVSDPEIRSNIYHSYDHFWTQHYQAVESNVPCNTIWLDAIIPMEEVKNGSNRSF